MKKYRVMFLALMSVCACCLLFQHKNVLAANKNIQVIAQTQIKAATPVTKSALSTDPEYIIEKGGLKVFKEPESGYYKLIIDQYGVLYCPNTAVYTAIGNGQINSNGSRYLRLAQGQYYVTNYIGLDFYLDDYYQCERENNDSFYNATSMNLDSTKVGNLNRTVAEDLDYYEFVCMDPTSVYINFMSPNSSLRYEIDVYTKYDHKLLQTTYTSGLHSSTEKLDLGNGEYYIRIKKSNNQGSYYDNEYERDYKFTLEANYKKISGTKEAEPNDTIEYANKINLNKQYSGMLDKMTDTDIYQVDIPYSMTSHLSFNIQCMMKDEMFKVELLSKNNFNNWVVKNCYYSYSNASIDQDISLPAGEYYFRVSLTNDSKKADTVWLDYFIELKEVKKLNTTKIDLSNNKKLFKVGDRVSLTAKFVPASVDSMPLTWSSSNQNVVTVSPWGLVTCVGTGSAKITAASQANPLICDTITVTVTAKTKPRPTKRPPIYDNDDDDDDDDEDDYDYSQGIKYDTQVVQIGDTLNLDFNYDDEEDLHYSSSSRKIATVNHNGNVYFKNPGYVTISVTRDDDAVDMYPFFVGGLSDDCNLKKLKASKGIVSKTGQKTYVISLSKKQKSTVILPVLRDSKANYKIDGRYVESKKIYVDRGDTETVKVKVIAEDGTTKTYKIKVERND